MAEKFEPGDVVSVSGVVSKVHTEKTLGVRFAWDSDPVLVDRSKVKLVSRPDKFKVGQLYSYRDQDNLDFKFMYLGYGKFYDYGIDRSITLSDGYKARLQRIENPA